MRTQQDIRRATQRRMPGIECEIAEQNMRSVLDAELLAFVTQTMDMSKFGGCDEHR